MIYFCIPVHDEERTIGLLLWKIRKVMAEFGRDYRILAWNDGSSDGTGEVLERYRRHVPLDVLGSDDRIGVTRAREQLLREAVRIAPYPKRDVAITLQGDFTEYPEDVVDMVKVIEGGADIVTGYQEGAEGIPPRRVRFARWLAPRLLGATFDEAPVKDPFCGYRAYRVIVLKKAFREVEEEPLVQREGWAGQVELLEKLIPHARRVEEVPMRIRYDIRRRESRFSPFKNLRGLLGLRGTEWPPEEAA